METKSSSLPAPKEIYVNEIEFCSKNEIYLFGFMHRGGKFHKTRYSISRKNLQTILYENKQMGMEIERRIERMWNSPHSVPASIDLVDLFGTTQAFKLPTHTEPLSQAFIQYKHL